MMRLLHFQRPPGIGQQRGPSTRVTANMPNALFDELRAYAVSANLTLSAAAAQLIARGIEGAAADDKAMSCEDRSFGCARADVAEAAPARVGMGRGNSK